MDVLGLNKVAMTFSVQNIGWLDVSRLQQVWQLTSRRERSGVLIRDRVSLCLRARNHTGTQHEGRDGICQDGELQHALKPGAARIKVAESCNILYKLAMCT